MVLCSSERRRKERNVCRRTALHNIFRDGSGPIQPLRDIVGLIPIRRPHKAKGIVGCCIEIRLIAVFPQVKLAITKSLARQRHGLLQGLPSSGSFAAEGKVKAVAEADVGPGAVGLEERGADGDGGGVVFGERGVVSAVDGYLETGVI